MKDSFYGWYLKCQSETQTLAVIPAVHQAGGKRTCSIQIITDKGSWTVAFPGKAYHRKKNTITLGNSFFDEKGMRLSVHTPKLNLDGNLHFGSLSPLKYHIMGPFALLPFMECSHNVWSMKHSVSGVVHVNGQKYEFKNALGYWEGDKGCSFPKKYIWTQCFFPQGSVMISVADIPVVGIRFTGVIAVVMWRGKEYRLATYLGARVVKNTKGEVRIVQGKLELEAHLLEPAEQPLRAPSNGNMVRTIHESASCRAFYWFRKAGRTLFAFESDRASFEFEQ